MAGSIDDTRVGMKTIPGDGWNTVGTGTDVGFVSAWFFLCKLIDLCSLTSVTVSLLVTVSVGSGSEVAAAEEVVTVSVDCPVTELRDKPSG